MIYQILANYTILFCTILDYILLYHIIYIKLNYIILYLSIYSQIHMCTWYNIRRPRLQQGERVRGEITNSKGQEAFITGVCEPVWNWRAHGFGSPAAAFEASFLQLPEACEREFRASFLSVQKATLGRGSSRPKDPVRLSLSWCLELASPRF